MKNILAVTTPVADVAYESKGKNKRKVGITSRIANEFIIIIISVLLIYPLCKQFLLLLTFG